MPVGGFLVHARGAQKLGFCKLWPLQLQANRQSIVGETARDADTADSREVATDGVDVAQIHRKGVGGFLAHLEGGCGRCGAGKHITLAEDLLEILQNQPTHFQ